jgi:hypothetical protein
MPILPLDYPEPFTATLGVMLYLATNDEERPEQEPLPHRFLRSRSDASVKRVSTYRTRLWLVS